MQVCFQVLKGTDLKPDRNNWLIECSRKYTRAYAPKARQKWLALGSIGRYIIYKTSV